MTKEQIEIYTYCTKYLEALKEYKKKLPMSSQHFGCGSRQPQIEFELEDIHKGIWGKIFDAINDGKSEVEKIIEDL